MGDATNLVLILAGELLKLAEHLLIMGLHPSEIVQGYDMAGKKTIEELESTLDPSSISYPRLICAYTSHVNFIFTFPTHTGIVSSSPQTSHRIKTVRI